MAHLHRFYYPADPPATGEVTLTPDEAHHALRVLRVRPGQPVELFNGRGHAWAATVVAGVGKQVRVAIEDTHYTPRPTPPLTLAQAWLNQQKMNDELVRQATALGADRIVFFRGDHSEKTPRVHEKWERLAIESCKQCGRHWLPGVAIAESLAQVLDETADTQPVIAAMDARHGGLAKLQRDQPVTLFIGPEGDFSEAELLRARAADVVPLSLGTHTLRSELAALAGLVLIQHHLGRVG